MKKLQYVDIFAGCGGLSLGLYNTGAWEGLFALEKDAFAFETLSHNLINQKSHFNWPEWLPKKPHDINLVLKKYRENLLALRGEVDLVAGGPPCQGFSMAGRRNEDDSRNKLIHSYIKFIRLVQPKLIIFENVKGFTQAFDGENGSGLRHSDKVISLLGKTALTGNHIGYNVHSELIDFSMYGIPQKRSRFILFGIRKGLHLHVSPKDFFNNLASNRGPFLKEKGIEEEVSLKHAISDLLRAANEACPDSRNFSTSRYKKPNSSYQKLLRKGITSFLPNSHRFAKHTQKTLGKFEYILKHACKNKTIAEPLKKKFGLKKYRVVPLSGDTPAFTITTLPDDYIHYSQPRIFTVRECARIQSFNDWYEFKGKYTTGGHLRIREVPRYSQVGNAVPPLFAEQLGQTLKDVLND